MSDEYNAAERSHVRLAEKEAKREENERKEIIKGLMSLAAGRAWVLARLESCHIFAPSFSRNALDMAFAEGERNVGLQILNDIMSACPDRYADMMEERNERDAARRASRAAKRTTATEYDPFTAPDYGTAEDGTVEDGTSESGGASGGQVDSESAGGSGRT